MNNGHSKSIHSYTDIPINNHAAFTYWTNISQHLPCTKHNSELDLLTRHKHLYHRTYAFCHVQTHAHTHIHIYHLHHPLLFCICVFSKAKEEILKGLWLYLHAQIIYTGINKTGCCDTSDPVVQQSSLMRQRVGTYTSRWTHNGTSLNVFTHQKPRGCFLKEPLLPAGKSSPANPSFVRHSSIYQHSQLHWHPHKWKSGNTAHWLQDSWSERPLFPLLM